MQNINISYNEFHISKKVRDLCSFDKSLYSSVGNFVFKNLKNVQEFQLLLNNLFESRNQNNKKVSTGQLNAMGLIDEILHYVCMIYRRDKSISFFDDLLLQLNKEFSEQEVDNLLLSFINEFPPLEVYNNQTSAKDFLQKNAIDIGTNKNRSNKTQVLEELILLYLANENPAFKPFSILFDDKSLKQNPIYKKSWKLIKNFSKKMPSFGPFDHDLISLLKEPVLYSPNSLKGQLEYIQKYWDSFIGDFLKQILFGLDTISEEEKAMWQGFGDGSLPEMAPYSFENLVNEYERFSADSEWMPNVMLMAKTVLVWLDQLSKQYGYAITTLDQIPDKELDILRDQGFTGLWLIGLWERSKASKRIKQLCGNPEAAASAYSLFDYNIAHNIGGWPALENLRSRLWQRGIRLASDMVPNHTGMDGDWVMNRPDLFIQRRDCPFPQYTFNGENLSQDSRTSIYLEDHYYSKNDCSVVFKRVDNYTGDVRYIYHGNDGTGLPWNDTAQLDFLNPETRKAVIEEILHVAKNFPIIRFDAAMVLAKKSIRRLWYPEPGHGGDIATRSQTGLNTQAFNEAIPNEFWREVVDTVARECPDTLLLAEAFWMMEGYFVRTLGMHRVYNSAFMNMLKKEENQKYRETVKNTITFDPQVLKRYVNFMNNPDEETAIAQFGDGDKYFGVCTLMVTMPGLPMFGHGQIEGYTEKYGMEYVKAYKDEKPNTWLVDRHYKEIFPLMKKRYLFSGVENFLFYDLYNEGCVNENVFAYTNGCGKERIAVFYNNKYERAYGWVKQSCEYAVKNGEQITMQSRSISEGLNLTSQDDRYTIFQECKSRLWYIRKSSEICQKGLFVSLNGFEVHVFMNIQEVKDSEDRHLKQLCEFLDGKGCQDIEIAWQELIYKELYAALKEYVFEFVKEIKSQGFGVTYGATEKEIPDQVGNDRSQDGNESVQDGNILLKQAQENFFKEVAKYIKEKQIPDHESVLSIFENIFSQVNNVLNLQASLKESKAKDIQKAIEGANTKEKFIHLLMQKNKDLTTELLCYVLLGNLVYTDYTIKFSFARKFNEYLNELKLTDKDLTKDITKLFVLSEIHDVSKNSQSKLSSETLILDLLLNSKYSVLLSGTNHFDNIKWFNKEITDDSLEKLCCLKLLSIKEKTLEKQTEQEKKVFALYKKLVSSKIKACYKCELWINQFITKKRQKKAKSTKN